jgi:uncharacterized membrane protein
MASDGGERDPGVRRGAAPEEGSGPCVGPVARATAAREKDMPNPKSTASFMGHPLHPTIVPFPIAFFVGALVTDLLYLRHGHPFWAMVSFCLLAAGLVMAAVAALLGLTDFAGEPRIRALRAAWLHMIANVLAVVVELVNIILRWHDRAGPIASTGIYLSIVAVLLLLFSGWMGGEMVFRHRVGVAGDEPPLQ